MYILKCVDDSYYTGSTKNLELRLLQHQKGEGAKHTARRLPVELVYCEEFKRIDEAFYREKQVQKWSRKKKEALINNEWEKLIVLAKKSFPSVQFASQITQGTISSNTQQNHSKYHTNIKKDIECFSKEKKKEKGSC